MAILCYPNSGCFIQGQWKILLIACQRESPENNSFVSKETSWIWQLQNQIRDLEGLSSKISLSEEERLAFPKALEKFNFAVTPYYLSLINPEDPNDPIRKQIIPSNSELEVHPGEILDPLAEEKHMVAPGLTHRYPDRALWYLSHNCPVYCRFCTRKRKVGNPKNTPSRDEWQESLDYIQDHKELKEVILSGGDPMSLSNDSLSFIISSLKNIPHINQIRIHSRFLVTLPQRFDDEFCNLMKEHFPIYMVSHFNHPNEITKEVSEAVRKLVTIAGIQILNQSVLLKGVNDSPQILESLFYKLIQVGIKPYYLHQCDEIEGISGFKVDIVRGIEIMRELRGRVSGICLPNYVQDLTGGGGKVPLFYNYIKNESDNHYIFENYNGREFTIHK
jgi:lysine 2,3-aminomutase